MNKAKRIVTAVLIAFGALLAAAFVMNNLAPSPVSAARAHCLEQGWEEHELSLSGFETSARISGSNGTVRFTGTREDQMMSVRIDLQKRLFGTAWRIVGYDETAVEEDFPDDS